MEGDCDNQQLWQGPVLFRVFQISLTEAGAFLFKYHNSAVFLKNYIVFVPYHFLLLLF